jgi:hypothetical protein
MRPMQPVGQKANNNCENKVRTRKNGSWKFEIFGEFASNVPNLAYY